MKSYEEMLYFQTFEERLEYLKLLDNNVSSPRHISEAFYKSHLWQTVRKQVIFRDMSFDLGVFGVYIPDKVLVHHINPIDESDIRNLSPKLTDLNNLITVSIDTHNKIHYNSVVKENWVERRPGDTKFW